MTTPFHQIGIDERRAVVASEAGVSDGEVDEGLEGGGLEVTTADKFVENVLGTYALPYAVARNVRVNGRPRIVPMVVEEPSVVAAASSAAKMARAGGGFTATADDALMIAQVQLVAVRDRERAETAILAHRREILALADRAVAGLVARGGGAREVAVRRIGDASMLVVHVLVDCRDAMGANLVNTVAEAIAPRLAELAGARIGLRILSNLCDRRLVRVLCAVPLPVLATAEHEGAAVADGIVSASHFATVDPYRAATHNKGIMNGIDAVVIATGNDWRAVEAGAHAYAARGERYRPLAEWRRVDDLLLGCLELPLALGTVGGTLRVHRAAQLALRLLGRPSAVELAMIAASVGLASNLAALRALATDGIQKGHMALHARGVALAAGATADEVQTVATMIVEACDITVGAATQALEILRAR